MTIFGQRDYAMRVWVDPDQLAGLNLTATDVVNAIRAAERPGRRRADRPAAGGDGQPFQFTLTARRPADRASEEFEHVVVKVGRRRAAGSRSRTWPASNWGPRRQDVSNRFDGKQTVGMAIFILPDANALEVADAVKAKMAELSQGLPAGDHVRDRLRHHARSSATRSTRSSSRSATRSSSSPSWCWCSCRSWRAALIPLAAVPVAIVGTFAAMAAVGFSLNNLTLFGLVLAVGIVVDDAIVVVEAVQHQIETGLAAARGDDRAHGRGVRADRRGRGRAVRRVLPVRVPVRASSAQFFQQFALTIAISTLISTFNSLTLSPALCALLLKPQASRPATRGGSAACSAWLFAVGSSGLFNRAFAAAGRGYVKVVGLASACRPLVLVGYGGDRRRGRRGATRRCRPGSSRSRTRAT